MHADDPLWKHVQFRYCRINFGRKGNPLMQERCLTKAFYDFTVRQLVS